MMDKAQIARELQTLGLAPRTWADALAAIKARLAPADFEKFSRAHKNFVGYRSDTTLSRFYGSVFALGVQAEVNGYRFARLVQVLEDLLPEVPPDASVLEVGAGAGYIATLIQRHCAPRSYIVYDTCAAARDELTAQGFTTLPHPPPSLPVAPWITDGKGFELILCVDSLGEINSDDDGLLSRSDGATPEELPELMEQRYGFGQKLAAWRPWLAPGGRILLWEPFAYPGAMEAVAAYLAGNGWQARVASRSPGRNYLEIRLNAPA